MNRHVHGTGAHADPREKRADLVSEALADLDAAFATFTRASESYTSAAIRGKDTQEKQQARLRAAAEYGKARSRLEWLARELAESPAVPMGRAS